jgi:hypothetical protein
MWIWNEGTPMATNSPQTLFFPFSSLKTSQLTLFMTYGKLNHLWWENNKDCYRSWWLHKKIISIITTKHWYCLSYVQALTLSDLVLRITLRGGFTYVVGWTSLESRLQKGDYHVRCLLESGLRINTWGRRGKKAGLGRVRSWVGMQAHWRPQPTPHGTLELERPFMPLCPMLITWGGGPGRRDNFLREVLKDGWQLRTIFW